MSDVVVLGWREWVALPDLRVRRLRAKVDTGARSSALHVDAQWRFIEAGAPWVGFRVSDGREHVEAFAPVHDEREVVDSGGHRSLRVFLRTRLWLAGATREIELNLCDRGGMAFPMLLGRSALAGAYAVDPARSFAHGRPPGARRLPVAASMPVDGLASSVVPIMAAGAPRLPLPVSRFPS